MEDRGHRRRREHDHPGWLFVLASGDRGGVCRPSGHQLGGQHHLDGQRRWPSYPRHRPPYYWASWTPIGPHTPPISPCGVIVDAIPQPYKAFMRWWDGTMSEVQWFFTDQNAPVLSIPTPFRSGHLTPDWPFDMGCIGEIPERFIRPSTITKPSWVQVCCYLGPNNFWEHGWPPGTPGVQLSPDGFAIGCSHPPQNLGGCSCAFGEISSGIIFFCLGCSCATGEWGDLTPLDGCSCAMGERKDIPITLHGCSCATGAIASISYVLTGCSCANGATAPVPYVLHGCSCARGNSAQRVYDNGFNFGYIK